MDTISKTQALNFRRFANKRSKIADENMKKDLLFPMEVKRSPTYDAFEKDIGILNFFFRKDNILRYGKKNRLTSFDFLAQIGGSIGLAMGISIISFVEIIYWLIFRLFRNITA